MEFDDIVAKGESALSDAVAARTQETLTLDFKVGDKLFDGQGQLTREGRRILGESLSAFSNSAGGVVAVGVDCRRNDDGIDCAQTLAPIARWEASLSSVSSAVGDLLQPKHEAIDVTGFASSGADGSGYLVIRIPRSDRRPHMSQQTHRYYRRSGSGSYMMEHVDIEDAFQRTANPIVALNHSTQRSYTGRDGDGVRWVVQMRLALENTGSVTAKHLLVQIENKRGIDAQHNHPGSMSRYQSFRGREMLTLPADVVVHPGLVLPFHTMEFSALLNNHDEKTVMGVSIGSAFFSFEYTLAAENMRASRGKFLLSNEDIQKLFANMR